MTPVIKCPLKLVIALGVSEINYGIKKEGGFSGHYI